MPINVIAERVTRWLWVAMALLICADVAVAIVARHFLDHDYLWGLSELFDFFQENNFPSYFSALLLMVSALLLIVVAAAERGSGGKFPKHWFALGLIFVFLSCDEMLALHERLITPLRTAWGTHGLLYSAWIIPYGIAFLILAVQYFRWLLALSKPTRVRFIIAGTLFMMGAVVLEAFSGMVWEEVKVRNLTMDTFDLFEDVFEMVGTILFIRALLLELAERRVQLVIGSASTASK